MEDSVVDMLKEAKPKAAKAPPKAKKARAKAKVKVVRVRLRPKRKRPEPEEPPADDLGDHAAGVGGVPGPPVDASLAPPPPPPAPELAASAGPEQPRVRARHGAAAGREAVAEPWGEFRTRQPE